MAQKKLPPDADAHIRIECLKLAVEHGPWYKAFRKDPKQPRDDHVPVLEVARKFYGFAMYDPMAPEEPQEAPDDAG